MKLPEIDTVLKDPSTSYWLKNAIADLCKRDPVDAQADAELLSKLIARRTARLT